MTYAIAMPVKKKVKQTTPYWVLTLRVSSTIFEAIPQSFTEFGDVKINHIESGNGGQVTAFITITTSSVEALRDFRK